MGCLDENAVLDLLEGRLTDDEASAIEQHFAACDECRSLVIELRGGDSRRPPDALAAGASSLWIEALAEAPLQAPGTTHPSVTSGPIAGARIADRYLLSHPIGVGGMGVVWAADRLDTGERVALKFLKSPGRERARRFLREAKIAASLAHPNIVAVHEILTAASESGPVIVMELLAGESLAARLRRRGRLQVNELAPIALAIIEAVRAAHAAGVVHRDLKPENVFLVEGAAAAVKVLDFGIAKRTRVEELATTTPDLTRTGAVMGTPYYMAPEQLFGEKTVDGRADVWALGVVIYECLAGCRPIAGDNFGQVLKHATLGSIAPLATVAPSVPAELGDLVMRMLTREPAGRPSLAEVSEVVARSAVDGRRSSAPAADPQLPYAATAVETGAVAEDVPTPNGVARSVTRTSRGRGVYAGIVGAAVLSGVVVTAWAIARPAVVVQTGEAAVSPPEDTRAALPIETAPLAPAAAAAVTSMPAPAGSTRGAPAAARPRPARTAPAASPAASTGEPKKLAGGVEKQPPY